MFPIILYYVMQREIKARVLTEFQRRKESNVTEYNDQNDQDPDGQS